MNWLQANKFLVQRFGLRLDDHLAFWQMLIKWSVLGSVVGILSGAASAIFLIALNAITGWRVANPTIVLLLPLGGFSVGWLYHHFAGSAARGNQLVIEEVNQNQSVIPRRMSVFILVGTLITHLFGGSAGREGTAIQMGASLADALRRVLGLTGDDRRLLLMAGISGGFGSVFGTPIAGFVFGMEVQHMGRIRYEGILPCLIAAIVGDLTTRALGATHSHYPVIALTELNALLVLKTVVAGIVFGLTGLIFIELTHAIKHQAQRIRYAPLRPVMGGCVVLLLLLLAGTQDYLGLSLPLIQQSVAGAGVLPLAFLLKLIFTAVTLGTGFMGGEVTPLFVIGSTLGYTLGTLLGVDPAWMAALGFVAVFAGSSNTPLACALMGMELFGGGAALYLIVACFIAYLASGHRSIYTTQIINTRKAAGAQAQEGESIADYTTRR